MVFVKWSLGAGRGQKWGFVLDCTLAYTPHPTGPSKMSFDKMPKFYVNISSFAALIPWGAHACFMPAVSKEFLCSHPKIRLVWLGMPILGAQKARRG